MCPKWALEATCWGAPPDRAVTRNGMHRADLERASHCIIEHPGVAENMNRPSFLLTFVIGCLLSLPTERAAVWAQAPGSSKTVYVHACAGQDGILRMVALTATCPSGQR